MYLLDAARLLTGVAVRERVTFASFDLERLGGGRMRSEDLAGKVTLVNFWASWCGPCRIEMPALDSLRRELRDPEFEFLTISDDLSPAQARSFAEELRIDFPVLLGRGRMKRLYHYLGLPHTVLLDRQGGVVQRWTGYAGEEQIAAIRRLVGRELRGE